MAYPVMPLGFLGSQGDQDTYRIERSLRFNSADSAYLNRTPASAGNRNTWTWSGWVKRAKLGTSQVLFQAGTASSPYETGIAFASGGGETDTLRVDINGNSIGIGGKVVTSALFRDISAWYHVVLRVDLTEATSTDRVKIYVNGVLQTSTATNPSNFNTTNSTEVNNNVAHAIGSNSFATGNLADYYLTEINFIDGQALTPSSFGETDAITGRWKAKAYSGTYGTNGFYLKFADNSGTTATTLGKDSSGNGNNWTPNNFSVTAGAGNDSLVDSPTNYGTDSGVGGEVRGNYATLNPLDIGANVTLVNGNLDFTSTTTAYRTAVSTIAIPSGSWYFEITAGSNSSGDNVIVGIQSASEKIQTNYVGSTATSYSYASGARKYNNATSASFGATWTSGDVIGIAFDGSALSFYKNGVSQGNAYTGLSGNFIFSVSAFNSSVTVNFGQRPFAYAAPTGFRSLCTTNLPTPTIQKPSKYMDVVTYTGTGAALTPTSSLGFSPDLVWIKGRSGATDHALYDTVRGAEKRLESNNTDAEVTSDGGVTSFDSGGFTLGTLAQVNTNTSTYVAWAWDEAPIAGMDIVSYTGNGTNRTIAHNLGVAPKMIIIKSRSSGGSLAYSWVVWHSSLTGSEYLILNLTQAKASAATIWNSTVPTSSVFNLGTDSGVNENNVTYIAYLFAEVEGFSKFGSYTGNGSDDGPFVWCGFRPRWVMIKQSDGGGGWCVIDTTRDTFNVSQNYLMPQSSQAETTFAGIAIDITSNGFKLRGNQQTINTSNSYIFAAFAESAYKYARAR